MVIKGNSVKGGARRLAAHLLRGDTNERVEIRELRDVAGTDLRGALRDIEAVGAGVQGEKIFYHASINPEEAMTAAQWTHAIDRLEGELGLTGQPRVVVAHCKDGRDHCHIVWSRIDLDRMALIPDNFNYLKHEKVARELEREFGHEHVQGAHIGREGKERPQRRPTHAEMLQAERTGLSVAEVKEQVTQLWRESDSGQAFAVALWQQGYVLARGDRRDYVVIDPNGGTHSLARRVEGAKARDIRERMADLDPARLPSVHDAKLIQRARQREAERLEEEERAKQVGRAGPEWTDQGGMVEQQHSAMQWVKKSDEQKAGRGEQTDRKQEKRDAEQAAEQRLQAYIREFGREPEEEMDAGRERGRGRGE